MSLEKLQRTFGNLRALRKYKTIEKILIVDFEKSYPLKNGADFLQLQLM
jgi:hypothetical protein